MFIHGFLLMEGHKMSKSLGNVLDPFEVIERFGADALRFYCFREVVFGQDGSVSAAGFESRYETELANEFGNLASRTLAMIGRYRDGVVPDADAGPRRCASGDDGLAGLEDTVRELLDRTELTQASRRSGRAVRRLNRYVEETRPGTWPRIAAAPPSELDRRPLQPGRGPAGAHAAAARLHAGGADRLLEALAEEDRELAAFGSRGGGQRMARAPAALSEDRGGAGLGGPPSPRARSPSATAKPRRSAASAWRSARESWSGSWARTGPGSRP